MRIGSQPCFPHNPGEPSKPCAVARVHQHFQCVGTLLAGNILIAVPIDPSLRRLVGINQGSFCSEFFCAASSADAASALFCRQRADHPAMLLVIYLACLIEALESGYGSAAPTVWLRAPILTRSPTTLQIASQQPLSAACQSSRGATVAQVSRPGQLGGFNES
jgi:hypothetical protein